MFIDFKLLKVISLSHTGECLGSVCVCLCYTLINIVTCIYIYIHKKKSDNE